jgi:hypothetical protein
MTNQVPFIFDPARRAARAMRAIVRGARPDAARWLPDAMAEDCLERLAFLRFDGARALVTGTGRDAFIAGLPSARGVANIPEVDVEVPIAGERCDLIVSLGELDTINDLPGALIHLRDALARGGLLVAAMVGAGSLPKLRQALLVADGERPAARIHPQIDSRAATALLQRAGFGRQVVDQHRLTVRYGSLDTLVGDLRDQGLTSVLADRAPPLSRAAFGRALKAFGAQADEDGKVSEHFEILTLTAWKD